MAECGQETPDGLDPGPGLDGADPGADWGAESPAGLGADGGAEIAEQLVEQALAGSWYHDPTATAETRAATRQAQRGLVEGMMAGLAPRDMSERIWAQQTTAAHLAATDAFKWLAEPDLPASARVLALRLAAQLMTVTGRQLAGLDLHRARLRAAAEAEARARRAAQRERREAAERARAAAQKVAAPPPPQSGVLVVPHTEPPEVEARAMAEAVKANKRWLRARQKGEAPGAAPPPRPPQAPTAWPAGLPEATRSEGPGFLVVPETLSPEAWTRKVKEYNRLMSEPDDGPDP